MQVKSIAECSKNYFTAIEQQQTNNDYYDTNLTIINEGIMLFQPNQNNLL